MVPAAEVVWSTAILNAGQAVRHPGQRGAVRTQFRQGERGEFAVGEYKFRVLIGVQMDDALGVVDHIAGTLQFRDHHCACGEFGQVDGPVLQGGIFHRPPGAVHRLKRELGVGDGF